jgi:uncharacterized protein YodC (DUF2158 family)
MKKQNNNNPDKDWDKGLNDAMVNYVNNLRIKNINNLKKELIMDELKCGDIVVLNSSDSPKMTVGNKGVTDANVYCLWFEGSFLRTAEFPYASLTKAPTKE